MRTVMGMAFLGLLICSAVSVTAEPPKDVLLAEISKCAVCKVMAENPKLMTQANVETHKLDNGMICVSTVPKEMAKEFAALHEKMMQNVEKVKSDIKSGKKVELCSFCEGMADLEKAGAKHQVIETATGSVSLLTSADPQVVKKIHAQADKAIAMQKKLHENTN